MRKMRTQDSRHTRAAFTLAELLIVIIIIVILAVISLSAYFGVLRGAKERAAAHTLKAVSNAVQAFYNETRDYPAMRFEDIITKTNTPKDAPWPDLSATPLPNADQSIAALIYQLQYRSSAGDLLKNLPSAVLVPLNWTVVEGGQNRPLFTIRDPWGNAIQYLRPRVLAVPPATAAQAGAYPLNASNLNNRVLLISLGKDGKPGQEGTDNDRWQDNTGDSNGEIFPDPATLKLGKADDILVQVGAAQ